MDGAWRWGGVARSEEPMLRSLGLVAESPVGKPPQVLVGQCQRLAVVERDERLDGERERLLGEIAGREATVICGQLPDRSPWVVITAQRAHRTVHEVRLVGSDRCGIDTVLVGRPR